MSLVGSAYRFGAVPSRGVMRGYFSCYWLLVRRFQLIVSLIALVTLTIGCATPQIQTADLQLLLTSELLAFIADGSTTREEVLLRLGIPSSQFEGERILLYQLRNGQDSKWHLVAPEINAHTGLRQWREGTGSLVLVFNAAGVLSKHRLVLSQ